MQPQKTFPPARSIFNQSGNHLWIITNHLIIKSSVWKNVSDICDDNIKIATKFFRSRFCAVYGCVIYFIIYVNLTLLMNATHVCMCEWKIDFLFFYLFSLFEQLGIAFPISVDGSERKSWKSATHWISIHFIECNFYDSVKKIMEKVIKVLLEKSFKFVNKKLFLTSGKVSCFLPFLGGHSNQKLKTVESLLKIWCWQGLSKKRRNSEMVGFPSTPAAQKKWL